MRLIFILTLILVQQQLLSQIFPKENSVLTYRIIGFSFPPVEKCNNYKIEIAAGNLTSDLLFKEKLIVSDKSDVNKLIAEVPEFGRQYTWRIISTDTKGKINTGKLHHFSTGYSEIVDTTCNRFRITANNGQYDNAYVFLDQSKVMYDMKGRPVWYLPNIDNVANDRSLPRDMKLTSRGTITFIAFGRLYESTYDGKILWTLNAKDSNPSDKNDHFHHEFTRLANGHYMVMGMEPEVLQMDKVSKIPLPPGADGKQPVPINRDASNTVKFQGGKLIEYDEKGKVVWSWKSSQYFSAAGLDFIYNRLPDGSVNTDVHDNAFYFDEEANVIYVSYKNINRIVKIKYPDGTLIAEYGEKFQPGGAVTNNGLFCGQHCIKRSANGYLYLFNNNSCNRDEFPKIDLLQEPENNNSGLKLIWEYVCNNEGIGADENKNIRSLAGGSVEEMQDGAILVCMGTPCAKVFIVNRDKKELWSGFAEVWKNELNKWQMTALYRASLIRDKNELSKLIWSSQSNH